ncbi:protealysin inhibitor emfourin [Kribbella sp. VKM Ac-2566]|uniref:protealysin inhibitor emfourin n=1 Tax=Kribbella sp. VKM Ac-2566 TaxID=2512218 RepID=UPI001EE10826|nr:protealysin inhibitor emfourin [Kribbella sp. VKM Ac-2566]
MILIGVTGVSRGCGQLRDRQRGRNSEEATMIVSVTRSGGFAGLTKQAELDTSDQPDADRLEAAVRELGAKDLGTGRPQPDRYVYRLEVRDAADVTHHTVAEQDMDATTAWLLDRILS